MYRKNNIVQVVGKPYQENSKTLLLEVSSNNMILASLGRSTTLKKSHQEFADIDYTYGEAIQRFKFWCHNWDGPWVHLISGLVELSVPNHPIPNEVLLSTITASERFNLHLFNYLYDLMILGQVSVIAFNTCFPFLCIYCSRTFIRKEFNIMQVMYYISRQSS